MKELYRRIKERRVTLGFSQDELAKKMGYTSRSSIAKIEAGLVDLPQSKIEAFANALGTTPGYLLGWDREPDDLDKKVLDIYPDFVPGEKYLDQAASARDDEIWQLREELRHDPKRRMLFDAARNVRKEDIETAVRILDALKGGDTSDAD